MIRSITAILMLMSISACAPLIPAASVDRPASLPTDRTPPELRAPAHAADTFMIVSLPLFAAGVGLLIWLPVEETIGLSICGFAATLLVGCVVFKVTAAHPAILWGLVGIAIVGAIFAIIQNVGVSTIEKTGAAAFNEMREKL
jgi:hypothetical protein